MASMWIRRQSNPAPAPRRRAAPAPGRASRWPRTRSRRDERLAQELSAEGSVTAADQAGERDPGRRAPEAPHRRLRQGSAAWAKPRRTATAASHPPDGRPARPRGSLPAHPVPRADASQPTTRRSQPAQRDERPEVTALRPPRRPRAPRTQARHPGTPMTGSGREYSWTSQPATRPIPFGDDDESSGTRSNTPGADRAVVRSRQHRSSRDRQRAGGPPRSVELRHSGATRRIARRATSSAAERHRPRREPRSRPARDGACGANGIGSRRSRSRRSCGTGGPDHHRQQAARTMPTVRRQAGEEAKTRPPGRAPRTRAGGEAALGSREPAATSRMRRAPRPAILPARAART